MLWIGELPIACAKFVRLYLILWGCIKSSVCEGKVIPIALEKLDWKWSKGGVADDIVSF